MEIPGLAVRTMAAARSWTGSTFGIGLPSSFAGWPMRRATLTVVWVTVPGQEKLHCSPGSRGRCRWRRHCRTSVASRTTQARTVRRDVLDPARVLGPGSAAVGAGPVQRLLPRVGRREPIGDRLLGLVRCEEDHRGLYGLAQPDGRIDHHHIGVVGRGDGWVRSREGGVALGRVQGDRGDVGDVVHVLGSAARCSCTSRSRRLPGCCHRCRGRPLRGSATRTVGCRR